MKNENPKFSYRNNENYQIHHGRSSNQRLELVYTKYEVNRSIIKGGGRIQPDNPVFDTLTAAAGSAVLTPGVSSSPLSQNPVCA